MSARNHTARRGTSMPCAASIARGAFHQPLDSLVHVAEPGFEPYDRLAVRSEPEVPGLDDACVHGTHGNLVQAFALGGQERVTAGDVVRFEPVVARAREPPSSVVEPRTRVGKAF